MIKLLISKLYLHDPLPYSINVVRIVNYDDEKLKLKIEAITKTFKLLIKEKALRINQL